MADPTSPTTDVQPELLPTQADERAAIKMLEHAFRNVSPRALNDVSFADIASAFARHRLTSTTPTLGDVVMVPREPTQAMLDATCATDADDEAMRATWKELLSAAPASPIPTSVANEGEREARYCKRCHNSGSITPVGSLDADECPECHGEAATWGRATEAQDWTGGRAWPEMLEAIASYWAEWEEDRAGTGTYLPEELAQSAGEFATGLADHLAALSPALDNTAVEGKERRECQAVWRCAIGDSTGALDVLKNRWIGSRRKAEREAGAVLSGVLDLVWAARDPAAGCYSEAATNGKALIERVRTALAAVQTEKA